MKKFALLFSLMLLIAVAVTAYAGTASNITASRTFAPSSHATVVLTKGSTTLDVKGISALRYQCSAACTYMLNGLGDSWSVAANTPETIYVPASVRSVVFTAASSAGTTYRFQKQ